VPVDSHYSSSSVAFGATGGAPGDVWSGARDCELPAPKAEDRLAHPGSEDGDFPMLSLAVALEAIFLVLLILMSQNRLNLQAEERNHLDLQINLLAEHENTKMLQMLKALCAHHGLMISQDPEIAELATRTEPQDVLE
jgi:hypothetical protein